MQDKKELNMTQQHITHIKKVKVVNLWGKYDINWELDPKVNILVGLNGSGKSTLLHLIKEALDINKFAHEMYPVFDDAEIIFNNGTSRRFILGGEFYEKTSQFMEEHARVDKSDNLKKYPPIVIEPSFDADKSDYESKRELINFAYISTFDIAVKDKKSIEKFSQYHIDTELDLELYHLMNTFVSYQLTLGKRVEKLFLESGNGHFKAKYNEIYAKKNFFIDCVNHLFEKTGKIIDYDSNEHIIFRQGDTIITPYHLSSGEKQVLIILLHVLLQNNQPAMLVMDEPEISLHLEWQESLLDHILQLNEHVQVIIATHSPGIMMNGWLDKVTEIETITTPHY